MIVVASVKALSAHRLVVEFSDGTRGVADLSEHVRRPPFAALASLDVFRNVRVEHGAIEWPTADLGVATEAVYALVRGLAKPNTIDQARENERRMPKSSGPA
jgi:hypothetical protein